MLFRPLTVKEMIRISRCVTMTQLVLLFLTGAGEKRFVPVVTKDPW